MQHDTQEVTIDLGSATRETRGAIGNFSDETLKQDKPGLSDD